MTDYTGIPGHRLTVGRKQSGKSPIGRGSPFYKTTASCSCGQWRTHWNSPPSKGGRTAVTQKHRQHIAEDTHGCPVTGCSAVHATDCCNTRTGRDHAARNGGKIR